MTHNEPTTGKAAAAAAARTMLADRITLVTALGDAIDAHRRAGDAVAAAKTTQEETAEAARTAHANAIDGGWTAVELRNAGLIVPASPRRKRATTVSEGTTDGDGSGDH